MVFAAAVMHGQHFEGKQTGNSLDVSTGDREKCFHLNLDALTVTLSFWPIRLTNATLGSARKSRAECDATTLSLEAQE